MKNIVNLLTLWVSALLWGAFPALAGDLVSVKLDGAQEVITLEIPQTTPHKVFTVPSPDRLVVDVPALAGKPNVSLPAHYEGNALKRVRYGLFDPKTSRFVFELNQPVRVTDVDDGRGRLVITVESDKTAAIQPVVRDKPGKQAAKPRKVEKPMIVIDAGHGGVDPGTIGPENTYEKDLTLAYAKALKAKLLGTGRYRVKLTRDDDTFIMLRERVAIARKAAASMFISIHADSAPTLSARGLSVYTVSENASDKEAEALANRENKADVLAGVDLSDERHDVAGILISLAERDTMNRSATLADELVTTLDDRVRLLQNSHRFAGFAVLKAPDIPSVLIEIGFLSNEEKMLKSKAYRDKIVGGVAAGVDAYFNEQRRVGGL